MDSISTLLVAIPALPLAAAIITAVFGPRWLKQHSHWPTIAGLIAAFVCSLLLLNQVRQKQHDLQRGSSVVPYEKVVTLWTWANVPNAYQQAPVPPGESPSSAVDGGMRDLS